MSRSSRICFASLGFAMIQLLGAVSPAIARDFEVSAFVGVREGVDLSFSTGTACIALVGVECPSYASVDDSSGDTWGLGAAVQLSGPWWLDLRWSQADGTDVLFFEDRELTDPAAGNASLDVAHLHGGLQYRFLDERRWSPFVTAFAGVTQIESGASTTAQSDIDLEEASFGLGAGILVDLNSRLGLRFEAREVWTDLPAEFFESELDQIEGSAGLRLRF